MSSVSETLREELEMLRGIIKGQIAHRLLQKKRKALDQKLMRELKMTIHNEEEKILKLVKEWKAASWDVSATGEELEVAYRKFWSGI